VLPWRYLVEMGPANLLHARRLFSYTFVILSTLYNNIFSAIYPIEGLNEKLDALTFPVSD